MAETSGSVHESPVRGVRRSGPTVAIEMLKALEGRYILCETFKDAPNIGLFGSLKPHPRDLEWKATTKLFGGHHEFVSSSGQAGAKVKNRRGPKAAA